MASALPLPAAAAFQFASSLSGVSQAQQQVCGGDGSWGIARRARCRSRSRSVVVARIAKGGENEVKLVVEKGKKEKDEGEEEKEEPVLLRIGVSLVTELLRSASTFGRGSSSQSPVAEEEAPSAAVGNLPVVKILQEDYERAYFLTGDFTESLYDDNCLFADPTIQFKGRDKYQRNLKLLVPFFEEPRLTLFDIQDEGLKDGEQERSINASWNLRTYLRLPWKPLIDVNGSTLYVINANSKIVKHIESWSVSGRQAVQQIFVPSDRAFFKRKKT